MVTKSFSSKYLNNDQVTSEKYLYISNVKFTMKGCPENFVIFWCFSVHDMNHMWFEFRSSPTTPSWFFTEKSKKYTQYLTVLTNKNIWHKIWLILHHPKKFEHNWIKNGPAVRFYFWTLFAKLNFLNFIACVIVHWVVIKCFLLFSLTYHQLHKRRHSFLCKMKITTFILFVMIFLLMVWLQHICLSTIFEIMATL